MKTRFLCMILISALALLMLSVTIVMAASVTPTPISLSRSDETTECAAAGCTCISVYKFDNWDKHDFSSGPWEITSQGNTIRIFDVTLDDDKEPLSFNWISTLPICCVIVKGGDDAYVFSYEPAAYSDTNLYAPKNNGKQQAAVSHVTFCWNAPRQVVPEIPFGTVVASATMMVALGAYLVVRKSKSTPI
ncbi:MAG: hypothetical protein ACPLIG_00865 [Candidatus Bathyarchaeales archaeon]